ncbi:hypothetical protein [Stieleria varia]|uniref:Uncharacterized protein n=1 Tax=Stieleria varia TaxID=2528005 RepID=A0A5C6B8J3_9BACT|nr:hypothetical protein [Stieleria varia]TWU07962.1 hypothetical protein Pla52n_05390 [Stieleria varia]
MTKYYVQSGTLRTIVQAQSPRKAALWAVHQAMQQVLPIDDDTHLAPTRKSEDVASRGVAVLSAKVMVSERGYDRTDASTVPTLEAVSEWNQMVSILDRLERMLHHAE